MHRNFLREYGLTEADVPLVALDDADWESPLSQPPTFRQWQPSDGEAL